MTRFTVPIALRLADSGAEELRRNHDKCIRELQDHIAAVPETARLLLGQQKFTANATYTPTRGTKTVLLRMVGGGGGGGGTTGGADFAFAGGGWSGVYWEKFIASTVLITGGAVSIGAAGAAGAAGAQGGTGGNTSISIGGVTYTAVGGAGGLGMANGAGAAVTGIPSTSGGSTSGADVNLQDAGEQGIRIAAGAGWSGCGGNTRLGSGGVTTASGNGGAANIGYGGGGGGSISAANNQTGGAGGAGVVIVTEFG